MEERFNHAFKARNVFKKIVDRYEKPDTTKLSDALEDAFVSNPNAVVTIFFGSKFEYKPTTQRYDSMPNIFMPCTWFDELIYVCAKCGYEIEKRVDKSNLKCNVYYFRVCLDFDCNP